MSSNKLLEGGALGYEEESEDEDCEKKTSTSKCKNAHMDFELSEEEVDELMEAFKYFDKNGDNVLSISELGNVLRAVGQNPTEEEVREIMDSADENNDQLLSFEEYAKLLQNHLKDPATVRVELEQAFHYFDKDRTRTLDKRELKMALMYCGMDRLSKTEADELLSLMDKDGNNTIDVDEFVDFLLPMNCKNAGIKD